MSMKKNFICIILARGKSKGIKNKNLIRINQKPLIYWTIKLAKSSRKIKQVWVSSDSKKILDYSEKIGALPLLRPTKYSTDKSSSESAWLHSIKEIEKRGVDFNFVLAPQVTSPLRDKNDFDLAIRSFIKNKNDSLFSCLNVKDFYIWKKSNKGLNLAYKIKRDVRQNLSEKFLENGSFYIFEKNKFKKYEKRLFGNVGYYSMKKQNSFQIDDMEDIKIINKLFKNY